MKNIFAHFRQDLFASLVVFLVALPLCLGIALASGAPLFAGIISGIIGGIVVGALSGSALGVSGPAAGLSVVVLGYIASLNDSWQSFLVAVVLMGIIQIIAGFLKMGNLANYFPNSVVKGMLSGIGLIIILKQIPHAIGYDKEFKDDFDFETLDSTNTFSELAHMLNFVTPSAIIIAIISIFILLVWEEFLSKKYKIFKAIPSPLMAVIAGITLSNFFVLNPSQLVQIPVAESFGGFLSQFTSPDFSQILNPKIYAIALVMAIIASIETLLCCDATDKLDPQKRNTPVNRELKAQGVGNIIAGLCGGLPITQVVVRSSANIDFGAKSKLSTILHGFFLLISAIVIPSLLNMIPLATLACILLVIGYKLAKPEIFKKMYKLGYEHFLPFLATIIGMLYFDLLKGVGIGMAVAAIFIIRNNQRAKNSQGKDFITALTKEKRDSLTPEESIQMLKDGNRRFVNNLNLNRNLLSQINETSDQQNPFAFILSCIDSRTSAELIFDQGLGDIFSCRIAGNILNDDIIGSMEFACEVAGAKLIMVLGHSGCGAIKGACSHVEMGKLTGLLKKIKPAVKSARTEITKFDSHHQDFIEKVAEINVKEVTKYITKESKIIRNLHKRGKIAIVCGMYDVATGVVTFY
ncbi:MAG: SulP family inorganic anion transporter [Proteobacteria bacterium]|nr:SulP family inorganic anion transporter [Pseudomonadota bacterium]